MSILVKGVQMPTRCEDCPVCHYMERGTITVCGCKATMMIRPIDCNSKPYWCPLVEVPPHGRLIDADALISDIKRQCREVFRVDAVSPDDFWIKRNAAYNERLWETWCESFIGYLQTRQTVIEAEEGE